ncbi:hypothetical protein COCMIDRAFT_39424 [Bipolaris oryzae ATCC 44560]|uniref:Uncharacterized protein n=1 Tax=Bipolaris oryzae ATCC 44560 TaxID=930090 RepID=W6YY81_COCMI|nr:uncharacterized protein COCMIDRAFT_39424 [Bipolaris oryzae ATCC 44560]EUC42530.1 hypothetical protein COCMIDRAFT_39424 [Bipolaris oryzae ATCC 44560]
MLNFTFFTLSTYHALRAISVATFPPGFLILFLQGILSRCVNPAIGIIPFFFSAAYSALILANEKICGCQSSVLTGTLMHLVSDLLLGIALLACLILDWVFIPQGGTDRGLVMLGTYGTTFLICNLLIHFYFAINRIVEELQPGTYYPTSCPQCQGKSFSFRMYKLNSEIFSGYASLLDGEGRPKNGARLAVVGEGGSAV